MTYNFNEVSVLIVESSPPLFQLLKGVLSLMTVPDKNIEPSYNMEEAYQIFCEKGHDLVIIDWLDTPDRGIQLAKKIRMESTPNPFVPILMTAGSGHKRRVLKARDAGISDYLVKPFSARQLAKKLENIVENPRPFVVCQNYIGPNRRTRDMRFSGIEKRIEEPVFKQINDSFSGASA